MIFSVHISNVNGKNMKYAQAYVQKALHNNLILQKKQKTTKNIH